VLGENVHGEACVLRPRENGEMLDSIFFFFLFPQKYDLGLGVFGLVGDAGKRDLPKWPSLSDPRTFHTQMLHHPGFYRLFFSPSILLHISSLINKYRN
jgi:hypothetical protein